jgi:hypothetical protein
MVPAKNGECRALLWCSNVSDLQGRLLVNDGEGVGGFGSGSFEPENGVLVGHSAPQSTVDFGAQTQLAELVRLFERRHEPLLLEVFVFQSVEALGDVFDLSHADFWAHGDVGVCTARNESVRVGVVACAKGGRGRIGRVALGGSLGRYLASTTLAEENTGRIVSHAYAWSHDGPFRFEGSSRHSCGGGWNKYAGLRTRGRANTC